jgi:hypothetical protein
MPTNILVKIFLWEDAILETYGHPAGLDHREKGCEGNGRNGSF